MHEPYMLDESRVLEVLGIEVETVTAAVHTADAAAPVPTCPGWTVEDVVRHLGGEFRRARLWLTSDSGPHQRQCEPGTGRTPTAALREGFEGLYSELAGRDPADHAATWCPTDSTYGFWRRRMLHETTVHRVDVQTAIGVERSVIPEHVALDGIDEVLTLWFGRRSSMMGLSGTRACTVAVQAGGRRWLARTRPGETTARRCVPGDTEPGDVTVCGDPVSTYLWLWGRAAPGTVSVVGSDEDAAGQLWALLRLATR